MSQTWHRCRLAGLFLMGVLALACSSEAEKMVLGSGSDATGSSTGSGTTQDDSMTTAEDSSSTEYTPDTTTTSTGTSTSDDPQTDPCGNDDCDTNTGSDRPCNVLAQNCPEQQKCMPYASGGKLNWDSSRCVDIVDDPNPPGAPCSTEQWPASGYDNCDVASMCFGVDDQSLLGTCAAFCDDTSWPPSCDDPRAHCLLANNMLLAVCIRDCDPMEQGCDEDQGCYPTETGHYLCDWEQSGEEGDYAATCEAQQDCKPGLTCVPGNRVLGCSDSYCCTEFCNLNLQQIEDAMCPEDGVNCEALHPVLDIPLVGDVQGACLTPL